jgi:hypothetical protein
VKIWVGIGTVRWRFILDGYLNGRQTNDKAEEDRNLKEKTMNKGSLRKGSTVSLLKAKEETSARQLKRLELNEFMMKKLPSLNNHSLLVDDNLSMHINLWVKLVILQ